MVKSLALIMLLMLIFSLGALAENLYDVNVYVAPFGANVEFYECNGFDAEGYDILGKKITAVDNGVNEETDYHIYSMSLDKGTYSFRATDKNGNSLGGMTFDVPSEVEVDNIGSETTEIYLRQVDVYTTTKIDNAYANESQYKAEVTDADGKLATGGKPYTDSSSRTRYPYMLYANGNAQLYTFKLIPYSEISEKYMLGTNTLGNQAISKGNAILTKSGSLPALIDTVISAPAGSKVQVFNQLRNFYIEEIAYASKTVEGGISSYTYRLPKNNANHTYRASMNGKITKAGYLNLKSADTAITNITFAENENPKIRPEYDRSSVIGSRMEDNVLLNINPQNYLRMNVGDTFKARAYRSWQIINSDTANIMIEPDFEYRIISGDSITINQENNSAVLSAVKNGVSIVEVTYDAIEIGGNTNYKGIYGATDPMRKGMFVVNVGGDTETKINLPKWDSDFDTVYFTEETGTYDFRPTSSEEVFVKCNGTEIVQNSEGAFTLPIEQGNNIVSVKAGNTTEYTVIKGNKVTVNIENATTPDAEIKQGDTVKISFDGLHMPMPKFSGIYNPGFGGTIKSSYKTQDGITVQSRGTQYDFISNHTISMTVYDEGTVFLTGGYISLTSMGFLPGSHRELTDAGIGANFNASSVDAAFCVLPDIAFEVAKNDDISYMYAARKKYCNLSKVSIILGTSTYQKSFSFSFANETAASKINNTVSFTNINTEFPLLVNIEPVNDVNMEFRYWQHGDTDKKTVTLLPGEEVSLDNIFTGDKTIYMEIAVTPKNSVFGGEMVYSYVAYKKSADMENPILKTFNVKDTDGNSYSLYRGENTGVLYTKTDYVCYIPKDMNEAVISLARLYGTADITVGTETKTVKTSETAFSSVSTENEETTVVIDVADGGRYTVKFVKIDEITNNRVVRDEKMAAVSFISIKDENLDFYLTSFNGKVKVASKNVAAGENTVYLNLSEFTDDDNIKLFVWDKNLRPFFTNCISE